MTVTRNDIVDFLYVYGQSEIMYVYAIGQVEQKRKTDNDAKNLPPVEYILREGEKHIKEEYRDLGDIYKVAFNVQRLEDCFDMISLCIAALIDKCNIGTPYNVVLRFANARDKETFDEVGVSGYMEWRFGGDEFMGIESELI